VGGDVRGLVVGRLVVGGLVDGAPVGGLVGALAFADIIIFMLGGHFIIPFPSPPHIIIIISLAADRDGAAAERRKREQAIFIVWRGRGGGSSGCVTVMCAFCVLGLKESGFW
jgi:hypothetical protein